MFGEIFREIQKLFPEYPLIPYLKSIENTPHEKPKFMSLYLLSTTCHFQGKKEGEYQLLVAHETPQKLSENDLEDFETQVYEIADKLSKNLPIVQSVIDFGVSDTYMYAYIKFTVRFA